MGTYLMSDFDAEAERIAYIAYSSGVDIADVVKGLVWKAVAAEREACAAICDAVADEEIGHAYKASAEEAARIIRARGQE